MSDDNLLWPLARLFGAMSMVAIGGANAVMPDIQRHVVDRAHWMDQATFANLFAIGQAAPGPNVLIVSLVGWQVAGAAGLLVATAAFLTGPCLLAFAVGRWISRVSGRPWFAILQAALTPIAIGLIVASGLVMARTASAGVLLMLISVGAAAFVLFTNRNPLFAIAAGMIAAGAAQWSGWG